MVSLNLTGRVTRDPELRRVPDPSAGAQLDVCHVRVAARDRRGRTVYLDLAEWGAGGRAVAKHLHQGSLIGFVGELRFREAAGEDGVRQFLSAVGHIEFLEGRQTPEQANDQSAEAGPGTRQPAVDEIPF